MFKKLRQLTKLNLLVVITICATTFIGAAFVYCVWNWIAPVHMQLPEISFTECVSMITALADICFFEVQILYKVMNKKKKRTKKTKKKRK